MLETEFDNVVALAFYASMGFMREKRLFRFYMNGKDAFRYVGYSCCLYYLVVTSPFRLVLPIEDDEVDPVISEDLQEHSISRSTTHDVVDATLAPSFQAMTT